MSALNSFEEGTASFEADGQPANGMDDQIEK